MNHFTDLKASVVLYRQGVYVETKLYEMGGTVFAAYSRGFVKLRENGQTSMASVYWTDLKLDKPVVYAMGTMLLSQAQKKNPKAA